MSGFRTGSFFSPFFFRDFFLGGGLGEELGWRGFALPRLQKIYPPLTASFTVGLFWGLWHLPDFWLSPERQRDSVPLFLLTIVALSVLYTWVYNRTGGSLLLVALLHASGNATSASLDFMMPQAAAGPVTQSLLLLLLWLVVLVVALKGGRHLGRSPA